jgi:hypothetical protein
MVAEVFLMQKMFTLKVARWIIGYGLDMRIKEIFGYQKISLSELLRT